MSSPTNRPLHRAPIALVEETAPRASQPRIGLALGGGSSRGIAHILILEALDELGIKPAIIAGTSMGAICGAAYATGMNGAEIRAMFEHSFSSRGAFFARFANKLRGGFSSLWSIRAPIVLDNVTLFEMLLPEQMRCDFAALKIPFVAVAADFYAMEQVVLDRGPLIPALAASCALPSLARPVVIEGKVLIDGGFVNPIPFDVTNDFFSLVQNYCCLCYFRYRCYGYRYGRLDFNFR